MATQRVTVIDDSPELLSLFEDVLSRDGLELTLLGGATSFDEILETNPTLLVVDLRLGTDSLPGWDIVRLARQSRALEHVPIVVCSAALDHVRQHESELEAFPRTYLLPKPFSLVDLDSVLHEALGQAHPPVRLASRTTTSGASI